VLKGLATESYIHCIGHQHAFVHSPGLLTRA
jgi:hypothetical protein